MSTFHPLPSRAPNAKPLSSPFRASYALPPTPPHLPSDPAPYKQAPYFDDEDMDLTEETVDDLVNQWWFTNSNVNDSSMNAVPSNVNEEGPIISSANSPMANSPLSSTSLDNNFEGLSEFPFFSSTEALQSPRSPVRYDCIAIAAPSSQTEPNTPLTDNTSLSSAPIKQEPASPIMPPVVRQSRGPGRPRKNASTLRVDTATAAADHSSKRKRHSQIERRYRCRLQAGMDSLGEVLPSSRNSSKDKEGGDSPNSSAAAAAAAAAAGPRSRKASILIDAREYILELEADKRLLAAENHSLKAEISRMKRQRVKETNYYAS